MALRTIRIFISSPGDVAEERLLARRLIGRLDAQFGGALQFEAILWERFPLVATASFQEQLQKPSDADIVVVVLWARLGTPLPAHIARPDGSTYASGTEFEFEDAVAGFRRSGTPRILTYLKTAPLTAAGDVASLEDATRQKRALDGFVAKWFRAVDGTLTGAFHNFATSADFEDLLQTHLTQLADAFVPAGVARSRAATWQGGSPFRGLQAFDAEHAPVFFGRTAAVASLLAKLRVQGQAGRAFVLIVGMSGGGKSSLLRAGVLPVLMQPGIVGPATMWRRADMRPSDGDGRPLAALERALRGATGDDGATPALDATELVALVSARLGQLAAAAPPEADGVSICHLALVVDQLEEVFTDERIAPTERDAFFAAIDALARSGCVWVLATMRSDAYSRIAEVPALVALKEDEGQFDLMPPSVREIGQIIRLPAAAAGLRFETRPNTAEKLDDVIRDAAARNPNALPLLQFLLEELYRRRSPDDVLTFQAYEELGGVEGALVQRAETVLAGVSAQARVSLPIVLRELVTFGLDDESRAVRRIAPRSAFGSPGAQELVDALLQARLLNSASDGHGAPVVSLAHEALLEFWPRAKGLIDEDRVLLLVHARLEAAANQWERNARSADLLLARGKPLAEARDLAAAGIRLGASETALLAASERRARQFAIARGGAVAALAVLTVVAGVAAYRARVESGRAQVQATTAQRTTDFMVSLFANADPDQSKGDTVTVRDVLDRGVVQIDRELAGEGVVRTNLLRAMGQAYNGLGLYPKGRTVLEAAVAQAEHVGLSDDRVKARMALADNRYQDGDYTSAETIYRAALVEARALHGDQGDEVALANTGLAEALADDNQHAEAEQLYRQALASLTTLHGERTLESARVLDGLGRLLFAQSRYDEARTSLERALRIRLDLLGPKDGNVASSFSNLATLNAQTGHYDEAADAYAKALPIYRAVFGPTHRRVAVILNNLGRTELLGNRLPAAEDHLSQALNIFRGALSNTHDELILPLNSIAMIDLEEGRLDEARAALDEAGKLAIAKKHSSLNQILCNEAELAVRERRLDDAERLVRQSRAALAAQYGEKLATSEAWRTAVLDLTEAALRKAQGDVDDARVLMSAAFPLLASHFGPTSFYGIKAAARSKELLEN